MRRQIGSIWELRQPPSSRRSLSTRVQPADRENPCPASPPPPAAAVLPQETVHVNMRRIGVNTNGVVPDFANLGVAAAIIDTGIDRRHPDLNVVGGKSFCSSEVNSDPYKDGLGHGTHVAGILGAKNQGQGIVGAAPGESAAGGGRAAARAAVWQGGRMGANRSAGAHAAQRRAASTHRADTPNRLSSWALLPPPLSPPSGIPIYSLKVLSSDGTHRQRAPTHTEYTHTNAHAPRRHPHLLAQGPQLRRHRHHL